MERSQLPADVQAELVPVERDISADPTNPANFIAEATVFENHNLEANALADYRDTCTVDGGGPLSGERG